MKHILSAFTLLIALTACKTTEPLYYHGSYNKAVYSYLKGDDASPENQIASLQQLIQQASAKGKKVAPGVHAHLGLLYFDTGNIEEGQRHFEQEKALFPESTHYLNFLLSSRKGV